MRKEGWMGERKRPKGVVEEHLNVVERRKREPEGFENRRRVEVETW